MKRIKDRPLTPLLIKQLKDQEERIQSAGLQAWLGYKGFNGEEGSYFSQRFKRL